MKKIEIQPFKSHFQISPSDFLSSGELKTLSSFKDERRTQQFLQSRYFLKSQLGGLLNISPQEISVEPSGEGKPFVSPASRFDFNISHSDDYFAVAIWDEGDIGIDLEKIRPRDNTKAFAERMFTAEEAAFIIRQVESQKLITFTKLWAAKEAIIKTANGGVFKHIQDIAINLQNWSIEKLPASYGNVSKWSLEFPQAPQGYVCAVASRKR